ncbi:MAG: GNAT family N-acetyltransferase [Taibaiella sp.]|jgi:RimJ/RimL family protein N-acetyltransferase
MGENSTENLSITLRETEVNDLDALFTFQSDEEAGYMAAFVNENWQNKDAYLAKWKRLLADETIKIRTIVVDNKVVGSVLIWQLMGEPQISYGVGKEFWNKGIVTSALQQFLSIFPDRPLYGRAASDNVASIKIMTKCGFKKINEEQSYAHARQKEITEVVFVLED